MHELSIANSLVELAIESIESDTGGNFQGHVIEVHLRLGVLSGVTKSALLSCYELVAENTPLSGSKLVIEELPLIIFCQDCDRESNLSGIQSIQCPKCHSPCRDIRQGDEMELANILLDDAPRSADPQISDGPGDKTPLENP